MMDPVLGDYARNLPDARESEVLSLFATIINKYRGAMIDHVPRIFEVVFQFTRETISSQCVNGSQRISLRPKNSLNTCTMRCNEIFVYGVAHLHSGGVGTALYGEIGAGHRGKH